MTRTAPYHLGQLLLAAVVLLTAFTSSSAAGQSDFRQRFIENRQAMRFQAQSFLVRQNKDIVPEEVEKLIKEASSGDKSFAEKMYLLDIANAMAKMHVEWNNGDPALLEKVEALQQEELKKERARKAALEKIKQAERPPGNFVMNTHSEELESAGLAPVIYPHWVHRSFFRCKVCHEGIFKMKRGANNISQEQISQGRQCGTCHNGKISFNATDEANCTRCHLFGLEESKPLIDLSYYEPERFKAIAERLGSEWRSENLPEGALPLDRFGFIDWVEMDEKDAFRPLSSIGEEEDTEGVRETQILFKSPLAFMDDILFSHKIHSTWVRCSLCHSSIFKPELGANKVKMIEMKEGKGCGRCHGRVAFTVSDCKRCHNHKGEPPEGALVNPAN